jgi:hypothetical protein
MLPVEATGIIEEEEEDPCTPNPKMTSSFVHQAQTFREL